MPIASFDNAKLCHMATHSCATTGKFGGTVSLVYII